MMKLEEYIIQRIRQNMVGRDYVEIPLAITLPCGCCGESRVFYEDVENLEGKTDRELLNIFESSTEIYLNDVTDWYCHNTDDPICLDLSGDSVLE